MSEEAVHKLLRKAEENPHLTKRLEDALARKDDPVASFLATAAEQGCEFTPDEFVRVMEGVLADDKPCQLTEADLNEVTGGGRTFATNATTLFRSLRAGPRTKQTGPVSGLHAETEEEEELIRN